MNTKRFNKNNKKKSEHKTNIKNLKIGSHNINGGGNRLLSHNDLVSEVVKHDIYLIQECWLDKTATVKKINGYIPYRSLRQKGKKRVFSGGLIFIKSEYENKAVKKLPSRYEDFLWVWISGTFFNLPCDLYLCNVYIPHEKSPFHEERGGTDPFSILAEESAQYGTKGAILYMGDFNSRVGIEQENYDHISNKSPYPILHQDFETEGNTNILIRRNKDKTVNNFGRNLITLCENLGMTILNGRTTGDYNGCFTFHGSNGSSTIHFAICSLFLYRYVQSFTVNKCTWFSDHSSITLVFKRTHLVNWLINSEPEEPADLKSHDKYKWNEECRVNFRAKMLTGEVTNRVSDISQSLHNLNISDACEAVTGILHDVAKATCGTAKTQLHSTSMDKSVPPCFRDRLKWASHNFKRAFQSYKERTGDQNRRHTLTKCRKTLKRIKYLVENYKKEQNIKKIAQLERKDAKSFWSSIKFLNKQNSIRPNITPAQWLSHFKQLLNMKSHSTDAQFADYVNTALPTLENCAEVNEELNKIITISELEKALKTMKCNKSPGPDRINNNMIKSAGPSFHKLLVIFI